MLVALTGGIGSGKSTVAQRWVELGAHEVDSDLLAREVVEIGTTGLQQLVDEFGTEILTQEGVLDRAKLAKVVFADEKKRLRLEAILHPLIQELAAKRISQLSGIVIYTIPLLAESKSSLNFDKVVTISCDPEVRINRLMQKRGLSEMAARARIQAQATDSEREALADYVIDSNCSLEELTARADQVFRDLAVS